MSAFTYRLTQLLHIRELEEEQRQAELGLAQGALTAERERLDTCGAVLRLATNPPADVLARVDAGFLNRLQFHIAALRRDLMDQQERVDRAGDRFERVCSSLVAARREVQRLEKHRDRCRKAWDREVTRKEGRELDDMAAARASRTAMEVEA